MKHAMNRFCAIIYGADDGLGGMGGIEELALLQLERFLERRAFPTKCNDDLTGEPKQEF